MATPNESPSQHLTNSSSRVADSRTMRSSALPDPRQRNDESWVEISSHPSSSSVSSIGDEIVTTGLRVEGSYAQRRRRLHPQYYQPAPERSVTSHPQTSYFQNRSGLAGAGTSSQEEYEESESESDRVLTSSTENVHASTVPAIPSPLRQAVEAQEDTYESSDDEDERRTALGRLPDEPFRPQPNAFTHPPSHLTHRHSTSSAIPSHHPRPSFSQRSASRQERRTSSFMPPSYREDHDAALRASLTTLLSCAAAVRGSPSKDVKYNQGVGPSSTAAGNATTQPMGLRLVPESDLMGTHTHTSPTQSGHQTRSPPSRQTSNSSASSKDRKSDGDKIKRAATPTNTSKSPRATKKKRTSTTGGVDSSAAETLISPTLMTWVVSAGVVVLVSVVGFGAGYVIGREVGRQEGLASLSGGGNMTLAGESCGREVIRGSSGTGTLRRFRWGSGMGRSVVA